MHILCPFRRVDKNITKVPEKRATIRKGAKIAPTVFFNFAGGSIVGGFGRIIKGRLKERL